MIYEIRTYRVKPGSVPEVEKRFGEAYEYRRKYSPLTGFFHTEIGSLNEIIHIWAYDSLEERARVRAEAAKDANWPPKIQEFVTHQSAEIVSPFPFIPAVQPGKMGPIFELRYYQVQPGSQADRAKGWESALPERVKHSPIVLAGTVEFGTANGFIHIWAYNSLDQRLQVREETRRKGVWPPPGGGGLIQQDNKIMLPSDFSPLQ